MFERAKRLRRRRPLVLLVAALAIAGGVAVAVLGFGGDDNGSGVELKDPIPEHHGFDVAAEPSKYAGPPPLKVKFTAKPFDNSGDVKYHWLFDDGTTSQEQNPTHTFVKSGYYQVVVEAEDAKRNRTGWNLILGVWPRKEWLAGKRGRSVKQKLAGVRAQGRRTEKRRKELSAKGLPVFEGTVIPPGTYQRQQQRRQRQQ